MAMFFDIGINCFEIVLTLIRNANFSYISIILNQEYVYLSMIQGIEECILLFLYSINLAE